MRCERKLKRKRGYLNRIKWVNHLISNEQKFTSKGTDINLLNLKVYVKNEYKAYFDININELEWF